MEEDFDNNRLYLFLQNTFRRMYEEAQNNKYTICLPCNSSVAGVQFDLAFVESHILKPSPFFKGEFYTVHVQSYKRTVHIDGDTVTTGEGFPEAKSVKIIGEEAGYNKDYEPYKIYLLETPLIPVQVDQQKLERAVSSTDLLRERIGVTECREFLENLPGCKEDFQRLQADVQVFNETYLVVKGYLEDAANKLREIYTRTSEAFMESTEFTDKRDSRFLHNVNNSIESVILACCQSKLYPVICSQCANEEQRFRAKLPQLSEVKATQLGLKQEYLCDMTASVQHLKQIAALRSPLEIIHKMKLVLDTISSTVNAHITFLQTSSRPDLSFITTDEMIPLLVLVISQCRPSNLVTQMCYVELFHWSTSAFDNLSFSLVSFKAAVQYIQSTDLTQLQETPSSKSHSVKTEPKLDSSPEEQSSSQSSQSKPGRGLQFDRQLDRINRMFQSTTIGPPSPNVLPPPTGRNVKKKQNLGSFLDALRDDTMNCSYGKQE